MQIPAGFADDLPGRTAPKAAERLVGPQDGAVGQAHDVHAAGAQAEGLGKKLVVLAQRCMAPLQFRRAFTPPGFQPLIGRPQAAMKNTEKDAHAHKNPDRGQDPGIGDREAVFRRDEKKHHQQRGKKGGRQSAGPAANP